MNLALRSVCLGFATEAILFSFSALSGQGAMVVGNPVFVFSHMPAVWILYLTSPQPNNGSLVSRWNPSIGMTLLFVISWGLWAILWTGVILVVSQIRKSRTIG
jgi:hypothetical protein